MIAVSSLGKKREHPTWRAIVAIPAMNEAQRIATCLAALIVQRDMCGAPLPRGALEIVVFANNCTDETAAIAEAMKARSPHRIHVVAETLPPALAHAGGARSRAMELAVERLGVPAPGNIVLTTDADTVVGLTWVSQTIAELDKGVDAVAGYVDPDPAEIVDFGPAFVERARRENQYLRQIAEIYALADPRPHDPWPNHRVTSGASLAVRQSAYLAVGGMPSVPLGEDRAFATALETAGFQIRHSMAVVISTSCRVQGRAAGGAADTIRRRSIDPEAPCDPEIEPARMVLRRAYWRGKLRRSLATRHAFEPSWSAKLGLPAGFLRSHDVSDFESVWTKVTARHPMFQAGALLRPADLPKEIDRAAACIDLLQTRWSRNASSRPARLDVPQPSFFDKAPINVDATSA